MVNDGNLNTLNHGGELLVYEYIMDGLTRLNDSSGSIPYQVIVSANQLIIQGSGLKQQ